MLDEERQNAGLDRMHWQNSEQNSLLNVLSYPRLISPCTL